MNKKLIVLFIVIVSLVGVGFFWFKEKEYQKTDLYKFKNDYNISLNTNIKYLNGEETINLFNKEKAILFIGSKNDEMCQNIMRVFTNVIDKYNIINFYYFDIDEEEPIFKIEDNKAIKVKEGSDSYYQLIEKLDVLLDEKIINENNKEYKTGEKELKLPFIITIKDQDLLNYHEGTLKEQDFNINNNEQRIKLTSIYSDMIVELLT